MVDCPDLTDSAWGTAAQVRNIQRKTLILAQNMLITSGPVYLLPVVGGGNFTFACPLPYLLSSEMYVKLFI